VLLLCDLPNADLVPLVERLADVALKLDPAGRILDLVSYNDELPDNLADAWRGELLTAVSEAGDEGRINAWTAGRILEQDYWRLRDMRPTVETTR
jgi:hypothetical protein